MRNLGQQFWDLVEYLKDPRWVANFQNYFGVEKVHCKTRNKKERYCAVDIDAYKKFEDIKSRRNSERTNDENNTNKTKNKSGTAVVTSNNGLSQLTSKNGVSKLFANSSGDTSLDESAYEDLEEKNVLYYRITNWFWYYVFLFGTQLGDENCYTLLFSFWFWNIDGAVGRRLYLVFNFVMYIGQAVKDVIRWPRPLMPPVVQIESKWALEYGMPSTHSMVGLAVPMGILYFTYGRYQYPFLLWGLIAITWTTLVCTSRLYLGVHSIADVIAGLLFGTFLCSLLLPLADWSDTFLMSNPYAPIITVSITLLVVLFYPASDRWSPAREDSTSILGGWLGLQLGCWGTYQMGFLHAAPTPPPYPIIWPTFATYGQTLLRMIVGGVIMVAARAIFKPITYALFCRVAGTDRHLLKTQPTTIENKTKIRVNLAYKLFTYTAIGFNMVVTAPIVFRVIGCERSTYYTEM